MKVTKYKNSIEKLTLAQKQYKSMLKVLQKDIQENCQLKMSGIAEKMEMKLPTLQWQFRTGKMSKKTVEKLIKILIDN